MILITNWTQNPSSSSRKISIIIIGFLYIRSIKQSFIPLQNLCNLINVLILVVQFIIIMLPDTCQVFRNIPLYFNRSTTSYGLVQFGH
mmetsp:Transcript_27554/g.24244  ORF Transcript_27554/g.24244 Transcript_27554/m.24244 type:complete len:88 (-) Transcript_27554:439-702(-)